MQFDENDQIEYSSKGIQHESAGGFVFSEDDRTHKLFVVLLRKIDGHYLIPKGHIRKGEEPKDAAIREVKEELSLRETPETISFLRIDSYSFTLNDSDVTHYKNVHLYVFWLNRKLEINPKIDEGFEAAEWLPFEEAVEKISFDRENLLRARQHFYLHKIKLEILEKFKKVIGKRLIAVILTGSVPQSAYRDGWSDIDLLIVVDSFDFIVKRKIAEAVTELENNSGIHHGVNVISKDELFAPILPDILLDGKTLQALIDLNKYPNRLIYSRELIDVKKIYLPDNEILKKYSISNIGMFLRRNRKTLTTTSSENKDIKELLKREIRASLIITKLAVQCFTATPQEDYRDVLNLAKSLFADFNFEVVEDNFRIIDQWHELEDENELLNIFRKVDDYIEKFTHYVFEKFPN